jgi:hypothetical protein
MLKKIKKRSKKESKKGSILLTTLIFMFLFSLLGFSLVYTSMTVSNQNYRVGLNKKAYYLADAGIQKASEMLWNKFIDIGMVPNKLDLFKTEVDNAYAAYLPEETSPGTGTFYIPETQLGNSGSYEAYIKVKSIDAYSVVVTIYSTGTTTPNNNGTNSMDKKIEADYRYYLSGTQLADFSYFTNNYSYIENGTQLGGSLATNGFCYTEGGTITIAGGDRYKNCKNFNPEKKIDEGGLFASKGFKGAKDANSVPIGLTGIADTKPFNPPDSKELVKFNAIDMPSLAGNEFYENSAKSAEDKAELANEKHGIYVYASAGDTILDASGNPDIAFGGGDGVLDAGEYIKVSDAVYGDNVASYTGKPSYSVVSSSAGNNTWKPGEKTNLVVTNTDPAHPIEIYGVVNVKGNVLIEGTIKGTGSIYAGKNIYSPDGLEYSRPPTTSGATGDTTAFRGFAGSKDGYDADGSTAIETARLNQKAWLQANKPGPANDNSKKDLVGLFAQENIVVGNPVTVPKYDGTGNIIKDNTSGAIVAALDKFVLTPGQITVDDGGTPVQENVNFNATDEALLGTDKVPNTRTVKSTDPASEYMTETAGQWDVKFYTASNPPPTGGVNPSTKSSMTKISATNPVPTGPYSGWTADQKNAVIPGSGEDLDGDGGYDGTMDLYDVICFDETKAANLRSSYPGGYNSIAGNTTAWDNAFNLDNTWGGNYDPLTVTKMGQLSGISLGSNNIYAKKIDGLTYTNHVWAGMVEGDINGGFITRIEAVLLGGMVNHDDRVVGGGESTAEAGCQVPQIEHMEITRWKE